MDDTISKQRAIDALNDLIAGVTENGYEWIYKDDALEAVNELPSAQPKRGKWRNYEGVLTCSECASEFYNTIMEFCGDDVPHFCPDCGADMRTKETDCDYERAVEQLEHDMLYEPTFNQDDGSM